MGDDPCPNEKVMFMKKRNGVEHQPDPIRIVALRGGAANGAATPAAQLTYRKGPLIRSVQVFTIFWGPEWKKAENAQLTDRINGFFDSILTSALVDELAEYNVGRYKISHGNRTGTITITAPALRTSVTDSTIQKMLQQLVSNRKGVPAPGANTLYFVYVQPGVRVVQGGAGSCQAFCGYHSAIREQFYYAVMPYPGCKGCTGGLSVFDSLTSTSSHELCEAITDPVPGEGWYDDTYGEVGDICAWETKQVAGFTVQLEWSNRSKRCV
jgi:hypothetical protein